MGKHRQLNLVAALISGVLITCVSLPIPAATTQDPSGKPEPLKARGTMLYENHCRVCHESTLHVREDRRALSIEDIAKYVKRWSEHLKLGWSPTDQAEVVSHLNQAYYHYK